MGTTRVIAIASGKGGVENDGFANLAVSLVARRKQVVLLDADLDWPMHN